jgi:hypothetical protein
VDDEAVSNLQETGGALACGTCVRVSRGAGATTTAIEIGANGTAAGGASSPGSATGVEAQHASQS